MCGQVQPPWKVGHAELCLGMGLATEAALLSTLA